MGEPNSEVVVWRPHGVGDAADATEAFPGSMQLLQNLITNPTTMNNWICRPAAIKIGDMVNAGGGTTFPGVGEVSVALIVGSFMYGLVRSTLNGGFDQPFCFNLSTNTFVTVTGITAANVPAQLPSTGAWTPPVMDVIGSKIIVCHQGFGSTSNFFGVFNISTPSAPVWSAGNLTGAIAFTSIPTFVAQFFNRAYYIVNNTSQPAVVFSDSLNPTNVTNATQVLTFNDNTVLTALGQLRQQNVLTGIVQGLVVFKGVANMFLITGDPALNTLYVNAMSVATGTLAPRSICATPKGLAFVAPDGVRIIDYNGKIGDPIGLYGQGVSAPFAQSVVPSRIAATCGSKTLRISTQNSTAQGNPQQEFWYDISSNQWSGPHTFPASWIAPYQSTFIECAFGLANIWQSDVVQSSTSTFVENGVQLNWNYQTTILPDNENATNSRIIKSSIDLQVSATQPPLQISAIDPNGVVFANCQFSLVGSSTLWGAFNWGQANWGQPQTAFSQRQIPWPNEIVFTDISIQVTGQSNAQVQIGALRMRYKILKYLVDLGAVG